MADPTPPRDPLGLRWLWLGLGLAVCVHLPGLLAGPVADDPLRIAETWTDLPTALQWFVRPFPNTPGPLPDPIDPKLYRPLWRLSYWLDGGVFGAPRAWTSAGWVPEAWARLGTGELLGPRLVNLGLHLGNGVLVYLLLRGRAATAGLAGLVAALWCVHPVGVEPAAWVSARGGLLAMAGLLAAGVMEKKRPGLALVLLGLALLSKETALVGPGLLWVWGARWRTVGWAVGLVAGVLVVRWRLLGVPLGGFAGLPAWGSWDQIVGQAGSARLLLAGVPADVVGRPAQWGLAVGVLALAVRGLWLRADLRTLVLGWATLAWLPHAQLGAGADDGEHMRFVADLVAPLCVAVVAGLPRNGGVGLVVVLGLGIAGVERSQAWSDAARLVQDARQQGGVEDLPSTWRGVPVRANVWPWVDQEPWVADGAERRGQPSLPTPPPPPRE